MGDALEGGNSDIDDDEIPDTQMSQVLVPTSLLFQDIDTMEEDVDMKDVSDIFCLYSSRLKGLHQIFLYMS